MNHFKLLFVFSFSVLYIGCYNVDTIRFEHENFSPSGNPYDDHGNYNIIPHVFDNKAFLIAIHNTYIYDSTLFWLKDESFIFKMDVSVYSEKGIDNIKINSCKIAFDDFIIIFDGNELENHTTRTSTNAVKPYLRNYVLFEKQINISTINNYIKRNIRDNSDPQSITVNIDIDYEENGEIKNWKNSTKFFIKTKRETYTPENFWGALS
jgi:hypothetical protein